MKKIQNEGLVGAVKNFTDAFFDGLKTNATNAALERAKKNKLPKDIIDAMEEIQKQGDNLRNIIKKYDK